MLAHRYYVRCADIFIRFHYASLKVLSAVFAAIYVASPNPCEVGQRRFITPVGLYYVALFIQGVCWSVYDLIPVYAGTVIFIQIHEVTPLFVGSELFKHILSLGVFYVKAIYSTR